MRKEEQLRAKSSPELRLVILGTTLALQLMLFPLPQEVQIGISRILSGLALFQLGLLSKWLLARSGAPSPTGLTSKSQADSLRRQAMKREPSSPHVDLREYGKPPSANQD